jgi:hypothetical protein
MKLIFPIAGAVTFLAAVALSQSQSTRKPDGVCELPQRDAELGQQVGAR